MSQMATPGVVLAQEKNCEKIEGKIVKKLRKYSIYLVLYGQI